VVGGAGDGARLHRPAHGVWRLSRDPGRPRLEAALPLALGGGLVFAFVLPAILRLARPVVWVREHGIQIARANSGYAMKYSEMESATIGAPDNGNAAPILTLRLRNGRVRQFGVADDVDVAALSETLRRMGVAVHGG
jgi:hypothetical protein